jgi:single-stranded DNA-binding protein
MNVCALVGRLSRAPSVKFEADGVQTCSFTLAVSEPFRTGTPYTLFVGCLAWGKAAETCSILNAEDLVAISGKLTWTKKRHVPCGPNLANTSFPPVRN